MQCTNELLHCKDMKKVFVIAMMILAAATASAKEDWKGRVIDGKGEPVAYANIAVLSRVDSTVLCGAVTEEDGSFNIVTNEKDGIMMVAMLGYKTQYFTPVNGMVITLLEDTASRKEYLKRVDIYLACCTEDLNAYMSTAAQGSDLEQSRETYSNIQGGIGVFAARRAHLYHRYNADDSDRPNVGLVWYLKELGVGLYVP